jgi:hypothetical protein
LPIDNYNQCINKAVVITGCCIGKGRNLPHRRSIQDIHINGIIACARIDGVCTV